MFAELDPVLRERAGMLPILGATSQAWPCHLSGEAREVTHHAERNTPFCGPPGIRTPNLRIKSPVERCRSGSCLACEQRVCVS
jgi:hypothetical protein